MFLFIFNTSSSIKNFGITPSTHIHAWIANSASAETPALGFGAVVAPRLASLAAPVRIQLSSWWSQRYHGMHWRLRHGRTQWSHVATLSHISDLDDVWWFMNVCSHLLQGNFLAEPCCSVLHCYRSRYCWASLANRTLSKTQQIISNILEYSMDIYGNIRASIEEP